MIDGFIGMLTILFVGLKLGGVISWSWWLVLSPLLSWFAIFLIVFIGMVYVEIRKGSVE